MLMGIPGLDLIDKWSWSGSSAPATFMLHLLINTATYLTIYVPLEF